MNIQASFNDDAIKMLPQTLELLNMLEAQDKANLYQIALSMILKTRPALCDMTKTQLEIFDQSVVATYTHKCSHY